MSIAVDPRKPQFIAGNEKRIQAASEWRSLIGAEREAIERALLNPTPALACKRLSTLFGANGSNRPGIVPKVGPTKLRRALVKVAAANPHGRRLWGPDMRLRELTDAERIRLVVAIVDAAPKWWRDA